jgi:membrane protease YdiL (CAAX protease family)
VTIPPPPPAPIRSPGALPRIGWPILIVPVSFIVGGIVFGLLKAFDLTDDGAETIAGVVSGMAIVALGLWRRATLPRPEQRMMISRRTRLVWAVLIGVGLALALRIAVGLIAQVGSAIDSDVCREFATLDDDLPTVGWQKVLLAVALVALAPVGEELVFRGLLLRGFARVMPFAAAALVSGVIFAVVHVQYWTVWPLLIGISLFGVVAAFVYRAFGYPTSVVMHAAFNAVAAIALFAEIEVDADPEDCD